MKSGNSKTCFSILAKSSLHIKQDNPGIHIGSDGDRHLIEYATFVIWVWGTNLI